MRSRILYISGDAEDVRNLSQILNPLPLILDHAESVECARSKLQTGDYDVIVTDAVLPDGKWLDVLHLVRESRREPQVIVTDQNADAGFWAEALNLGACDFLTRPFDPPEVQRILFKACSRAGSRLSAV